MELEHRIAQLERSHAELRAALICAGRRIHQLRRNDKALSILRRKLKDARVVAKGDPRVKAASAP